MIIFYFFTIMVISFLGPNLPDPTPGKMAILRQRKMFIENDWILNHRYMYVDNLWNFAGILSSITKIQPNPITIATRVAMCGYK